MMLEPSPQVNAKRDDEAYTLMRSAIALTPQGDWKGAAAALEEAARLHAQAGRSYDEARCLQMAATLRRSAGEGDKARPLIERAAAAAPPDQPLAVSIAAERAETAFAQGRYPDAISAWTSALESARRAGLKADGLSALLRHRAAASVAAGQLERAAGDFDEACQLLEKSLGREAARFVRIQQAGVLWQHDFFDQADQVITGLESSVRDESPEPHLAAEMLVLRARLGRTAGKLVEAVEYARRSRAAALQAVAPTSYFAACVELAEALQAQGKLAEAYGTLASAWGTLSDVIGNEAAQSWIEPCLFACQLKWGEAAFQNARNDYETLRRSELKRER